MRHNGEILSGSHNDFIDNGHPINMSLRFQWRFPLRPMSEVLVKIARGIVKGNHYAAVWTLSTNVSG